MRVVVGLANPVALEDADDCSRFSVAAPGLTITHAAQVLSDAGAGAAAEQTGHLLVSVDAVRSAAEGRVPADWAGRFDAMLAYAAGKGWLSADGTAIVAHVEGDA